LLIGYSHNKKVSTEKGLLRERMREMRIVAFEDIVAVVVSE
jgi:hypothetical protein